VLKELGYDNVSVKVGDGYLGWPECGPFDATIVTVALDHVPPLLIEQLKVGGRLVMPLGPAYATQQLTVIEKVAPSETRMRSITLVDFVPFYPVQGLNAINGAATNACQVQARSLMKGKTVVITGATSGIGEVTAEALAQMGARNRPGRAE
jgi:hypothetical protein